MPSLQSWRAPLESLLIAEKSRIEVLPKTMHTKRILLVDDEPHIVRLMKLQLEREGYVVDTAGHGEQALEQLQQCMPDVLITDIQMPRMNGKELCERILRDQPNPRMLMMIATSRTEIEHREWSRAYPQVTFLEKPISLRKLIDRLKDHFAGATEENSGEG